MSGPIELPRTPAPKTDRVRMIDFGGPLTPSLGGPVQTIMRMGTRHALDITLPPVRAEPHGRIWATKLRMAKLYGAMTAFRQDGFRTFVMWPPPVINGGGQSGSTIRLRGFGRGSYVRFGEALSIIHAGRRYLHFAASEGAVVGEDGLLELEIVPMLRVIPDDGSIVEFGIGKIQGSLSGNEVAWERPAGAWFEFGTITITEDA